MKTNGELIHGGRLKPNLAETWAQCYVRFAQAMRDEEKLPLWALTVQNEPDVAQPWESCLYSPWEERGFIADELGPALEQAKIKLQLFGWDHNRSGLMERAQVLLGDHRSAKYLAGLAIHWYQQEDFAASRRVLEQFPNAQVLFTEGCVEGGPHRDEWEPAERYARNIVGDLSHGVCGWIDWNIALDLAGGPNHVGNFCHAPVLIDTEAGAVHYQPSFYAIAQFSKFAAPGSAVLTLDDAPEGLQALAFATPDEALVAVICNPGDEPREFALDLGGERRAIRMAGHAIHTYRRAA
jgi:glucosylceramidase